MLSLYEFSQTRVNRSNNSGRLNYMVLDKLMKTDFAKDPKFVQFSSKSDEKKLLRRNWQRFILNAAENAKNLTKAELTELDKTIIEVQGAYKSAKDLYNAKNFEKEEVIKNLFAALKNLKK